MWELLHQTHLSCKIAVTMYGTAGRGKGITCFNGILALKKEESNTSLKKNHFIITFLVGYVYINCLSTSLTHSLLFWFRYQYYMGWPSINDGTLSPEDIWTQIPVLLRVFCASPRRLKFPKGSAIVNVPSLEQSPRDPLRGYDFWKMLNTVLLKIRSL